MSNKNKLDIARDIRIQSSSNDSTRITLKCNNTINN